MPRIGVDLALASQQQPDVAFLELQHRVSGYSDPSGTALTTGTWSSVTAYTAGQIVTYGEMDWLAIVGNTNVEPGADPLTWIVVDTDNSWIAGPLKAPASTVHLDAVDKNLIYDVRVRYHFSDGSVSDWTTASPATGHAVVGWLGPPSDVTSLKAQKFEHGLGFILVKLTWDKNTDPDWDHFEIRAGGTMFSDATFVSTTKSEHFAVIARHDKTYRVKAVDAAGNYSTDETDVVVDAEDSLTIYSITAANSPWTVPSGTRIYVRADTTAGAIEIDLLAATASGDEVYVKNISGANNVNVKPNGADTVEGTNSAYAVVGQNASRGFVDSATGKWEAFT
jgi:hypothetical protein